MKAFRTLASLLLTISFSVTAVVGQSGHFDIAGMDTKTSACADFYQYANGGWLSANPIPAYGRPLAFRHWLVIDVGHALILGRSPNVEAVLRKRRALPHIGRQSRRLRSPLEATSH